MMKEITRFFWSAWFPTITGAINLTNWVFDRNPIWLVFLIVSLLTLAWILDNNPNPWMLKSKRKDEVK